MVILLLLVYRHNKAMSFVIAKCRLLCRENVITLSLRLFYNNEGRIARNEIER